MSENTKENTKFKPIKINFTEEEYQTVKEYAAQCGITIVELCRALLKRYHPKPMPTIAFRDALNRLYGLHGSMEADSPAAAQLRDIILHFQKQALLPERGESIGSNKSMGNQGAD